MVVGEPSAVWTESYFIKNERANIDAQAIPLIHALCETYRHIHTHAYINRHMDTHAHMHTDAWLEN